MKIICLVQANIRIDNVYSISEMSFYQFTDSFPHIFPIHYMPDQTENKR